MVPLFNGTQEETIAWIKKQKFKEHGTYRVCIGKTMKLVTILEYLNMYN